MDARAIRGWLLTQPRPASVKVTIGQDSRVVACSGPWARVADTIAALEADTLEALDAQGNLLRAARADAEAEDNTTASLATDAETRRFEIFTSHVAAAYQFANETAFARLADLFDAMVRRSESQERVIDQFREQAAAAGVSEGDLLAMMMQQFMTGGAKAAAGGAKPNGAANGAKKPNGQEH